MQAVNRPTPPSSVIALTPLALRPLPPHWTPCLLPASPRPSAPPVPTHPTKPPQVDWLLGRRQRHLLPWILEVNSLELFTDGLQEGGIEVCTVAECAHACACGPSYAYMLSLSWCGAACCQEAAVAVSLCCKVNHICGCKPVTYSYTCIHPATNARYRWPQKAPWCLPARPCMQKPSRASKLPPSPCKVGVANAHSVSSDQLDQRTYQTRSDRMDHTLRQGLCMGGP